MEAATTTQRALTGEKAQRIVDAMRSSVARRGVAGSTFDHVAREAGVSRGLLHYYFGTKEALLVEVVRRDCDLQMLRLDAQLSGASGAEDLIALLVETLGETLRHDPEAYSVAFELFCLAQRNEEVAAEFGALLARIREHVGALLVAKAQDGTLGLAAPPAAVADVLFALADGLAMRLLSEPDHDFGETIAAGVVAVRALLR